MTSLINFFWIWVEFCKCANMDCKSALGNFAQSSVKYFKWNFKHSGTKSRSKNSVTSFEKSLLFTAVMSKFLRVTYVW